MNNKDTTDSIIKLDPKRYIVSKTDSNGIITYGNDYFVEISGYSESRLIGQSHNIVRHPDMPQLIFKILWERLEQGQDMMAIIKNLSKDGRAYWVTTEFETKRDRLTNKIIGYTAFRKAASQKSIDEIEQLYSTLNKIESKFEIEDSEKYLMGYLEDKKKSYDEFIDDIVDNKGLFKIFFSAMKKIFK